MRSTLAALCLMAPLIAAAPSRADPAIAGAKLYTASHGQPFCPTRERLQELLRATIAEEAFPIGTFGDCAVIPDTATVTVLEDLSPRSRYMHVVRARINLLFGPREGYTYSVGLYTPKVFPRTLFTFR